ncbi:hypothetical protein [Yersinia phage fPS-19]|uniref:Uncharacterized protein n=10 Tax=Helsettvirus fPS9 TaxID=2733625 RepID=A0A2D0PE22_9CAUD|nr:hypothetical protein HOS88_gp43 [Yersinia phage fPS-9]SOO46374.1 hypothetical protein [Yersinia phage fPS-52]SOO46425.1 hypothetical protein [Yersinia phage fPS-19]SOO46476.1 hypothetical protein [Yersinia phage fPS-26]SOO46527.1 hypothetical protein [Yersinia phage fPS-7]SOO46679.1 hypothetical protein [Yersinia phage fPS-86]SOO46729.1 hypothetical protein [Yersinia phage fPS-50]SOO46780.1 hypothetical protein [Yersinia phage fPS-21]SOR54332.1 hypothetical protein [Yersinia phage fPS-10
MEGMYESGGYWKITIKGKVHGVHRLLWEVGKKHISLLRI